MKTNLEKRSYPYSKTRVYWSLIIAILSIILVVTLLLDYPTLMFYYILSTIIMTFVTFVVKVHLYALITSELQEEAKTERNHFAWKNILLAFFMLLGGLLAPLLLARFLGGYSWFILITSLITGVSFSEIIIYHKLSKGAGDERDWKRTS